jgi:NACalpha-BTF3-like transcription factor
MGKSKDKYEKPAWYHKIPAFGDLQLAQMPGEVRSLCFDLVFLGGRFDAGRRVPSAALAFILRRDEKQIAEGIKWLVDNARDKLPEELLTTFAVVVEGGVVQLTNFKHLQRNGDDEGDDENPAFEDSRTIEQRIIALVSQSGVMRANNIVRALGKKKSVVLAAIRALVGARRLVHLENGYSLPPNAEHRETTDDPTGSREPPREPPREPVPGNHLDGPFEAHPGTTLPVPGNQSSGSRLVPKAVPKAVPSYEQEQEQILEPEPGEPPAFSALAFEKKSSTLSPSAAPFSSVEVTAATEREHERTHELEPWVGGCEGGLESTEGCRVVSEAFGVTITEGSILAECADTALVLCQAGCSADEANKAITKLRALRREDGTAPGDEALFLMTAEIVQTSTTVGSWPAYLAAVAGKRLAEFPEPRCDESSALLALGIPVFEGWDRREATKIVRAKPSKLAELREQLRKQFTLPRSLERFARKPSFDATDPTKPALTLITSPSAEERELLANIAALELVEAAEIERIAARLRAKVKAKQASMGGESRTENLTHRLGEWRKNRALKLPTPRAKAASAFPRGPRKVGFETIEAPPEAQRRLLPSEATIGRFAQ